MIVVLGRPRVYRPQPNGPLAPGGLAAEIAMSIGRAGEGVEIVGSIGDDPEGDRVVVDLDAAGVGHAALLRDPAARTPTFIRADGQALPRLEAADVELGLRYVPECRVLVIAAVLDADALSKTLESAQYHGAAVIMVAPAGTIDAEALSDEVTLLERPQPEDEEDAQDESAIAADDAAFGAFVAEYAVRLGRGEPPSEAFAAALGDSAWEPSTD
jgi:sugar/nucleoside kinase (ribokinase family)